MTEIYFVAGTDTEVGKTYVSCQLLKQWKQQGFQTQAIKAISAGAELTDDGWRNEDGEALQAAMTLSLPYEQVNPILLPDPVSPNITAAWHQQTLTVDGIVEHIKACIDPSADKVIIEGAGGWFCPISTDKTLADVAIALNIPVILVVGMRLGCLNHAILTATQIQQANVPCMGWYANQLQPDMLAFDENIETLKQHLSFDYKGMFKYDALGG